MRKWFKRIAAGFVLLLMVAASAAWWAIRQTEQVPEFYRLATMDARPGASQDQQRKASRRLTRNFERLQSAAAKEGSWNATFTNEEINAWLDEELPEKFPHLLRRGLSEPRVAIEDGRLRAAARLRNRRFDLVVSCDVRVELTEQPNLLAIRLENLRAGALAIPWSQFLDRISSEAAGGDISVHWDMTDTGPVALLAVPGEHPKFVVKPVMVESIELCAGEIWLAGRSGESAQSDYRPQTSIHRFVSYQPDQKSRRQAMVLRDEDRGSRIR